MLTPDFGPGPPCQCQWLTKASVIRKPKGRGVKAHVGSCLRKESGSGDRADPEINGSIGFGLLK